MQRPVAQFFQYLILRTCRVVPGRMTVRLLPSQVSLPVPAYAIVGELTRTVCLRSCRTSFAHNSKNNPPSNMATARPRPTIVSHCFVIANFDFLIQSIDEKITVVNRPLYVYPECRMCSTSPSCTMYSLPSSRKMPLARASASEPASSNWSQRIVSARMKCFSRSE